MNRTVHNPHNNYYQPDLASSLNEEAVEQGNKKKEMDDTPPWMGKRTKLHFPTDKPNKPEYFVVNSSCYNTCPGNRARPMHIDVYNGLLAIFMRFGDTDEGGTKFKVSIDSCAGLNIVTSKIING